MRRFAFIASLVAAAGVLLSGCGPGTQLWVARYRGPAGFDEGVGPYGMAVSRNGSRVFVTGLTYNGSDFDFGTVAYDTANGSKQWAKQFGGATFDAAYNVAVSPDGSRVFVTGTSGITYTTVAYDASNGTQLWAKGYSGGGNDGSGSSLAVSPDGSRLFVTGSSRSGSTSSSEDYATIAYDTSNGTQLWVTRYNGPASGADYPSSLGTSADGTKVFVTGTSDAGLATGYDYATVAYDTLTGTQLWVKRYNSPANDSEGASSLGVSADGTKVFVTGTSYGGSTTVDDFATIAYDTTTGTPLWMMRYNNSSDSANSLVVSPDGSRVFVTGTTGSDYATVAYDASNGTQLWAKLYNGPQNGFDVAFSVGVSPDGTKVFVTGRSDEPPNWDDYATVAYATSNGAQLWAKLYNGPVNGADDATALAVSPAGAKVFVTGSSAGSGGLQYATLAYSY